MELKPGYKQTEVGVIPNEWKVKPLGELGRFKNGINKGKEDFGHGFPFVNLMDVFGIPKLSAETDFGRVHSSSAERKLYELRGGDVLFVRSSVKPEGVGLTTLVPVDLQDTVFSGFLIRYRDNGQLVNEFKEHCFWQSRFRQELIARSTVSANTNINQGALKALQIAFPTDQHEQRAIAAALSDADRLTAALDQLIAKKRDLKQATMQQLLTGRQRLPGFSGQWRTCVLSEVATHSKGKGIRKDEVVADGLPCVRYGEIYTRHQDYIRRFYSFIPADVAKRSERLRKGDLLFAGSGETAEEIGKCVAFLGDEAAYAGGDIVIFRPIAEDSMYLGFLMNESSIAGQKARLGHGDAVVHISSTNLGRLQLRLPSTDEQTAIAATLSDMDAEIDALQQLRDKTRAIKQGMMQELLTGRARLVPVQAIPQREKEKQAASVRRSHNWQINEAVVISVLAAHFGSERFPLGRKRYTKLSYLLHRHAEKKADGYLKKAAGPYNPNTRYKGPEKIARRNGYVRTHACGQYLGLVAADNIAQAEAYFQQWYGSDVLRWLVQFRYKTNDELELLTTVDMAVQDLVNNEETVSLEGVKKVIGDHPEWEAKLTRRIFADAKIAEAMKTCEGLFNLSEG